MTEAEAQAGREAPDDGDPDMMGGYFVVLRFAGGREVRDGPYVKTLAEAQVDAYTRAGHSTEGFLNATMEGPED